MYGAYNRAVKTLKIVNLDTIDKVRTISKAAYRRSRYDRRNPATGEIIKAVQPTIKPHKSIKCSLCGVTIKNRRVPFIIATNSSGTQTNKSFKLCPHCFQGISENLINELSTLPKDVLENLDVDRFIGMLK